MIEARVVLLGAGMNQVKARAAAEATSVAVEEDSEGSLGTTLHRAPKEPSETAKLRLECLKPQEPCQEFWWPDHIERQLSSLVGGRANVVQHEG